MHRSVQLVVALSLTAFALPAFAVDYDQIDRTIRKEPKYQSDNPGYTLLLFGPEAKLKVWMVFDGDTVYVDRNMDGDLTGADERFDDPVKYEWMEDLVIADPDGKTKYVIQGIGDYKMSKPPGRQAAVTVSIDGPARYRQYCAARLWSQPEKTSIAHFDGPLTITPGTKDFTQAPQFIEIGTEPVRFDAEIGTVDPEHQCWVCVISDQGDEQQSYAFPGRHPKMEVEFPASEKGGAPIKRTYVLDQWCCGVNFYGEIQPPAGAGVGTAKVSLSFDAWAEGKVRPSTAEVPVVATEPKQED